LPGYIYTLKGYGVLTFWWLQGGNDTLGSKIIEKYTNQGKEPNSFGFVMKVQEK